MTQPVPPRNREPDGTCRILSLDGGGAKGFYTLGVLRELEAMLGGPLCDHFDVIFGTSTGSIIASLIALGRSVEDIHSLYGKHVPSIMKATSRTAKSAALARVGTEVFGEQTFESVTTNLGVVATKWQIETPMIFKGFVEQAHGRTSSFVPGFGCTISDAVQASCSAYPFFNRKMVKTSTGDLVELIDGGYCANNPTLYALADAVSALRYQPEDCRVISVGCGGYPQPRYPIHRRMINRFWLVQLLQKTIEINTASMDQLRMVLFENVPTVRINDTFDKPEMATDLFEHDMGKLNLLRQRGADSFASRERLIGSILSGKGG